MILLDGEKLIIRRDAELIVISAEREHKGQVFLMECAITTESLDAHQDPSDVLNRAGQSVLDSLRAELSRPVSDVLKDKPV